jgi:GT2 family glycosyltransferase
MLIAAIPTLKPGLIDSLLLQIDACYVKPDIVLIINNTGKPLKVPDRRRYAELKFNHNIGVNGAWNHALEIASAYGAHLSILNDDISIGRSFFDEILKVLEHIPKAGVICPNTDSGKGYSSTEPFVRFVPRFVPMKRKEGWAFTIRDKLVKLLPLIPKELFIFFGDDWIWRHTYLNGYNWIKDLDNKITHLVGQSLTGGQYNIKLRKKLEYERNAYRAILSNGNGEMK